MPRPTDREGIESLRGTVTYLSKFVLNLSDIISPLNQLTHHDVEWNWGATQEKLKCRISEAPVLVYFDPLPPYKG